MNNLEIFAGFEICVCTQCVREIWQLHLRTPGGGFAGKNCENECVFAQKFEGR